MEVESFFQERGRVTNIRKLWWLVAGLLTVGSGGCGEGLGTSSTSAGGTGGSGGTAPMCPDDPADGPVSEECGIWVSASLGNDENAGTQAAPVKSLAHAIELAKQGT